MKMDVQTMLLLALIAFVVMKEREKKQAPKSLLSEEATATIAALVKQVLFLKDGVVNLQKRIDDLHKVS